MKKPHTMFANGINCFTGLPQGQVKSQYARHEAHMTYAEVIEARKLHDLGLRYKELSEKFGKDRKTLYRAINGRDAYAGMI